MTTVTKGIAVLALGLLLMAPVVSEAKTPKPPKDTTPPSITSLHIQSNNANPSKAKAGDTVTITLTANEKVTPIVLVESKTLFAKARNTSGNTWDASYVVNSKDPTGKVDYLIALTDAAGNIMICSSAHLPFIKYCPTTDGSSVTIYKNTTPPPTPDTTAPVIAAHADVFASTTGTSATVSYTPPTATDDRDGSAAVSCSPSSGSSFALGTTTVTCTAQDSAGNSATSTFFVIVTQRNPEPYTMASQPDESHICGNGTRTWRYCDDAGTFSFTDEVGEGVKTIDLGLGSNLDIGTLVSVTIAKDAQGTAEQQNNLFHPWDITLRCFTDAAHTSACGDWADISDDASDSSDSKYWTADFSSLNRTFNQDDYYVMIIDDIGWDSAVFGSQNLEEPYWVIKGLR